MQEVYDQFVCKLVVNFVEARDVAVSLYVILTSLWMSGYDYDTSTMYGPPA